VVDFRGRRSRDLLGFIPWKANSEVLAVNKPKFQCISSSESGAPGKLLNFSLNLGFSIF
jgi:hypothetical protein